jgi:hypothetical protein
VKFQPLGTQNRAALSDCRRYFITQSFSSERWDVWLQVTEGPNERLAKNLADREAAEQFCDQHQRQAEATHAIP